MHQNHINMFAILLASKKLDNTVGMYMGGNQIKQYINRLESCWLKIHYYIMLIHLSEKDVWGQGRIPDFWIHQGHLQIALSSASECWYWKRYLQLASWLAQQEDPSDQTLSPHPTIQRAVHVTILKENVVIDHLSKKHQCNRIMPDSIQELFVQQNYNTQVKVW